MIPKTETTSSARLVSVLIPCWGCRDYIGRTISSALAQTYEPLEILVVEDHGDDGTYEEALKFRDPRLRVIRNDRNFGQYGNKNEALRLASGDLIKYLDGDDLLTPDCVSRLVSAWKQDGPGVGVVFARFNIIDADDHIVATPSRYAVTGRVSGLAVLDAVTRQRQPGSRFGNVTPHLFYRPVLESIGGFPKDNAGPGDIETFVKLLCVTDAYFIEDIVGSYRSRPGSMISHTFGVRECTDSISMVEHVETFFRTRADLPAHLRDPAFIREWKVWAGAYSILPCYLHKLRRRPSQFDQIRQAYFERGLGKEFDRFVRRRFIPFVWHTLVTKLRSTIGIDQHPPLFGGRYKLQACGGGGRRP